MTSHHSGPSTRHSQTAYRLILLAGLLTAFLLRLVRLGAESLWYDETVSAYLARLPLGDMLAHTALDIHPPAYYALLHGWGLLAAPFGKPSLEFLLAFPSLWFGLIGVALLVPLGRSLLGPVPACVGVWLAALHPFLLWYGQEVRMYTLAEALGLLCLLAAVRFTVGGRPAPKEIDQETEFVAETRFLDARFLRPTFSRAATGARVHGPAGRSVFGWLALYIAAGAAGLYTLYYLAFALLAINIAVFASLALAARTGQPVRRALIFWTGAQLAVLILFAAWLPLLVRQVVEPPVPPWRTPWTSVWAFLNDVAAGLSAYVVGQSVPALHVWLWAAFFFAFLLAYYGYTKWIAPSAVPPPGLPGIAHWLPLYLLVPPAAIFAISVLAAPIHHSRYLATYAPAFALVEAAGLVYLFHRRRVLFALASVALVAGTLHSISRYWLHADYRPDDHRAAVAMLAERWRPGDAILANAGWVYTAIDTYWPTELSLAQEAMPPGPLSWTRLTGLSSLPHMNAHEAGPDNMPLPVGVTTGSVDGDPSLGWGSEDADFYAISRDDTLAALDVLDDKSARIWHYRLYDTVNDPGGVIRNWLSASQHLESDTLFSGNGFLRLEEYTAAESAGSPQERAPLHVDFDNGLGLDVFGIPEARAAGDVLYVPLRWRQAGDSAQGDSLAASLRLVGGDGATWAQHDEALPRFDDRAAVRPVIDQVLALPIPMTTPPGAYDIQLVVYHAGDLRPLQGGSGSAIVSLGSLDVALRQSPPSGRDLLTRFDYLELLRVQTPAQPILPGQSLDIDLVWRPAGSDYVDAYDGRISLVGADGETVATTEKSLGAPFYPSSHWATGYPVRDRYELEIPGDLATGEYRLALEVFRSSDGLAIPSRPHWWWPVSQPTVDLGAVAVGK